MRDFSLKRHQIQFSAGALPQIPLEELTALPQTLYLDLRKTGGEGERKVEEKGVREGETKGGNG